MADQARLQVVRVLGVDEQIWRLSRIADADPTVTGMVDLTRDELGVLHATLFDVVPRAGPAPRMPRG